MVLAETIPISYCRREKGDEVHVLVCLCVNCRDSIRISMCDLRKFCQRGSNSTLIFFDKGPNSTKSGCHYWPASETPFKWRFAGGPMMVRHVMLAWYMCSFVIFLGDLDQYC